MATEIPVGRKVRVKVPGSSANLGPGFDSMGLALSIYDHVEVEVIDSGLEVEVTGEGQREVPLDEHHLVIRPIRTGLKKADRLARSLPVRCDNSIPHTRGQDTSAPAAV